jgi:hypothetical protein
MENKQPYMPGKSQNCSRQFSWIRYDRKSARKEKRWRWPAANISMHTQYHVTDKSIWVIRCCTKGPRVEDPCRKISQVDKHCCDDEGGHKNWQKPLCQRKCWNQKLPQEFTSGSMIVSYQQCCSSHIFSAQKVERYEKSCISCKRYCLRS